jgi:hypothetical protein
VEEEFLRLQSNTKRHEAGTRAISGSLSSISSKFSALGTLAKPNRGVPRCG